MDLIYTLGTGSKWSNNEIRFSLRSVVKNLEGYGHIYIIGEDPGFLSGPGLTIIPHPDEIGPHNADGNIIRKVIRACQIKELSDDFIFINDDNYFIKPMHVADIYPFHKGDMNYVDPNIYTYNYWGRRLGRTRRHLMEHGIVPLHFDHHAPIVFNKAKFPDVVSVFDYATDVGLTIKSLYGSVIYPGAPKMNGEKVAIFKPYTLSQISKFLANALYAANNDKGLNDSFKYWLFTQFPEATPWETEPISDKIIAFAQWLDSDRDYEEGVRLYSQYIPNKVKLKRLYQRNRSSLLKAKLVYELTQKIKAL